MKRILHIPDGQNQDHALCHARGAVLIAPVHRGRLKLDLTKPKLPQGGWAAAGVTCKRCLLRDRRRRDLIELLVQQGRRIGARERYGEQPTGTVEDIDYFGGG